MSGALLLVDEMGYDPMSREEASLFFRLVSYRYGRGAMIITTNNGIRDRTELLAGDEAPPPYSTACSTAPMSSTSAAPVAPHLVTPSVALPRMTGCPLTAALAPPPEVQALAAP
jgi:hypothetical protein